MIIHYMLPLSQHTCSGICLLFCNIKTWCQPFIILVYCNPAAWISRNTENIETLMIYCRHLCQRILWSQIIQIECCQINLSNLPKQYSQDMKQLEKLPKYSYVSSFLLWKPLLSVPNNLSSCEIPLRDYCWTTNRGSHNPFRSPRVWI